MPLSVLSFWIPLLLSLRACREQIPQAHQFLLTYWIFYVVLNNTTGFLQRCLGFSPLADLVNLSGEICNLWLFYGHGCLVLANYYLPDVMYRFTGYESLGELDHRLITPVTTPIFQALSKTAPLARILGPFSPRIATSSPKRLALSSSFSQSLHSVLDYGLEQLCYMDTSAELHERYLQNQSLLLMLRLIFNSPPKWKRVVSRPNAGYTSHLDLSHRAHTNAHTNAHNNNLNNLHNGSHNNSHNSSRVSSRKQAGEYRKDSRNEYRSGSENLSGSQNFGSQNSSGSQNFGGSQNLSASQVSMDLIDSINLEPINYGNYGYMVVPKQREKRLQRAEQPRFVSLGESWTSRAERSRSLSDSDMERQAREQAEGLPDMRTPAMMRS